MLVGIFQGELSQYGRVGEAVLIEVDNIHRELLTILQMIWKPRHCGNLVVYGLQIVQSFRTEVLRGFAPNYCHALLVLSERPFSNRNHTSFADGSISKKRLARRRAARMSNAKVVAEGIIQNKTWRGLNVEAVVECGWTAPEA